MGEAVTAAEFAGAGALSMRPADRMDLVSGGHGTMVANGHTGIAQDLANRLHMHAVPGSDLLLSGAVAVVDHDPQREVIERSLIGLLSGSGSSLGWSRYAWSWWRAPRPGHALRVISTMKDAEESYESRRQRRELLDHVPAPFLLSARFSCIGSTV